MRCVAMVEHCLGYSDPIPLPLTTWSTGMRGSTIAELYFDDVRVPVSQRLGKEGGGITNMMRNLELERLTLAAMSVGIGRLPTTCILGLGGIGNCFLHAFYV